MSVPWRSRTDSMRSEPSGVSRSSTRSPTTGRACRSRPAMVACRSSPSSSTVANWLKTLVTRPWSTSCSGGATAVSVAGGMRKERYRVRRLGSPRMEAGKQLFDLWSAAHLAERLVAREMGARGVEGEQLALLLLLAQSGRPRTQTALARELGVPFTTLGHAAGRLVARGEAPRGAQPRRGRAPRTPRAPAGGG